MAVNASVLSKSLRLTFDVGLDGEGEPILVNRSYRNVKTDAQDQDIFDVSQIMGELQEHTLSTVRKVEESELLEA